MKKLLGKEKEEDWQVPLPCHGLMLPEWYEEDGKLSYYASWLLALQGESTGD